MAGDVINRWVGLTWTPEEADLFLEDGEVEAVGYELVYREDRGDG